MKTELMRKLEIAEESLDVARNALANGINVDIEQVLCSILDMFEKEMAKERRKNENI